MLRLIVVTFVFPLFVVSATAQVSVDEVKAITRKISDIEAVDKTLQEALTELRDKLDDRIETDEEKLGVATEIIANAAGRIDLDDEVEAVRVAVEGYQNDRLATHILTLATSLETALTTYKTATEFPEDTRAKLLAIGTLVDQVDAQRPVAAIDANAARLRGLIENSSAISSGDRELASLGELRKELTGVEANHVLAALGRRIEETLALLNVPSTDWPPLRASDITNLRMLKTKIDALLPVVRKTGLHVVSARFGRVSGQGNGGSCDVTHAMRKKCQGAASCTLPASGTARFCGGEDPAPFAKSREKGVVLSYFCLTADDATWTAVVSSSMSFAGPAQSAVIRTTDDEVFCKNTTE